MQLIGLVVFSVVDLIHGFVRQVAIFKLKDEDALWYRDNHIDAAGTHGDFRLDIVAKELAGVVKQCMKEGLILGREMIRDAGEKLFNDIHECFKVIGKKGSVQIGNVLSHHAAGGMGERCDKVYFHRFSNFVIRKVKKEKTIRL